MSERKVVLSACLTGDEPAPGAWCPACSLPSAMSMRLTIVAVSGVRPAGRIVHCFDCDLEWIED